MLTLLVLVVIFYLTSILYQILIEQVIFEEGKESIFVIFKKNHTRQAMMPFIVWFCATIELIYYLTTGNTIYIDIISNLTNLSV